MKLKLLVKLVEKLLGMADHGDAPRADMYLPDRLLAMSLVLLGGGTGCGIAAAFHFDISLVAFAGLGVLSGIAALLCWKNQSIRVLSDERFAYTTMFGNTYTYNFSDIEWLRRNRDSMTLFVAGKKVHMESMAVLSDRLVELINKSLSKRQKQA